VGAVVVSNPGAGQSLGAAPTTEASSMRAFSGQHSDRVAIRRTQDQKAMQLRQIKEQFAALKSHAAPALREAMAKRIADLEQELRERA
jgi:DNA-binding transcriptional MerR regulator